MRKRTRLLISTLVLVIMIGVIFLAWKPELSSAQTEGFRIYQLAVYCGNSGVASVIFGHEVTTGGTVGRPLMGTHSVCAGNCPGGGTVTLEAALAGLPAQVSAALQAKVDKHQADAAAGKGRPLTCLLDGKKSPEDKKCEPPPPWFDTSSDCKELKSPQLAISGGSAILYMCGYPVFYYTHKYLDDSLFVDGYRGAMRDFLQSRGSAKVCCDKFKDAVRTGKPCDPRADVDCDGQPNKTDFANSQLPDINDLFSQPEGAPVDPRPAGLTDAAIMPPAGQCKDCKLELIKGVLKCNPDPTKRHSYEATWRCPSTGAVVEVVKLSKPGARCTPFANVVPIK